MRPSTHAEPNATKFSAWDYLATIARATDSGSVYLPVGRRFRHCSKTEHCRSWP